MSETWGPCGIAPHSMNHQISPTRSNLAAFPSYTHSSQTQTPYRLYWIFYPFLGAHAQHSVLLLSAYRCFDGDAVPFQISHTPRPPRRRMEENVR